MSKNIVKKTVGVASAITGGAALWLTNAATAFAATDITGGATAAKGSSAASDLNNVLSTVVNILFFVIGAAAVLFLIIGGLSYITSQGDSKKVESAKNTILYAVIGIVVAIMSYALVNYVITQFAGK
jgi:hypothetical protein